MYRLAIKEGLDKKFKNFSKRTKNCFVLLIERYRIYLLIPIVLSL